MQDFGVLNWSILVAYLIANILLGFILSRKIHTAQDFFLGSKNIPWWAIGVSVVATYVSALSFLGGPAWSYTDGFSVIAIHLNYPIVIFLVISFFLPFFYNSGVASIYDYLERRFGIASRCVISAIFLVSQALTSAAVLYATSLVIQFITGIDVVYAIIIVTVVALIYTMMGGIAAVIWTDLLQALILLVGAVIIFVALLQHLPTSFGETLSALKAEGKLNPLDFSLDFTQVSTVWSGVIAMTLFHLTVYGANQMLVQRTLASKTIGDAKKSFLMMGYAAFFIYFLFFLLGVLFYNYYAGKEFENGNTIILEFAASLGIPGLMGLLAAAVVAASMSSLDSAFNSMATVSTVDFYQKLVKKDGSPEHYLKISRAFTVVWALLIIVPAIMYAKTEGSILETLSKVGSFFVGAKLSMYGLGFFSKHTSERGLLIGVVVGFVVLWYTATYTPVSWPWFCAIGAAVNILVSITTSLLLDGRQKTWSDYTIKGQQKLFVDEGRAETDGGWYLVPGKIDAKSYGLLVFFVCTLAALWVLDYFY